MFKILDAEKQKVKESNYTNMKLNKKIKKLKQDELEMLVNLITSMLKTLRKEPKIIKKNKTSVIIIKRNNDFIINFIHKNEIVYEGKQVFLKNQEELIIWK